MEHNKSNHSAGVSSCPMCSKTFCDLTILHKHIKIYHGIKLDTIGGKTSQCAICLQKFDVLALKRDHIKVAHPEACFFCRFCSKCFFRIPHRKTHELSAHNVDKDYATENELALT
jgi:hypothetical protein